MKVPSWRTSPHGEVCDVDENGEQGEDDEQTDSVALPMITPPSLPPTLIPKPSPLPPTLTRAKPGPAPGRLPASTSVLVLAAELAPAGLVLDAFPRLDGLFGAVVVAIAVGNGDGDDDGRGVGVGVVVAAALISWLPLVDMSTCCTSVCG